MPVSAPGPVGGAACVGGELNGMLEVLIARVRRSELLGTAELEKLRVLTADALVTAVMASGTPAARSADALAAAAAPGWATAVGCRTGLPTETAVQVNSLRIHALLRDDSHAATMVHPGAVVLPVALGLAEELGSPAALFLQAVAAGYETMTVLAAPVAEATARRGLRNTTLFGPAAAAVAAGVLMGLDDLRLGAGVLIACGVAGGTLAPLTLGSPEWRFQPGLAACSGLAAARLAATLDEEMLLDMRATTLEGPGGLYATLVGHEVEWERAVDLIECPALLGITHKVHSTCGANQGPATALGELLDRQTIDFADIAAIDVHLSPMSLAYPGTEGRGPFTGDGVYMSRPLALAAIALSGGGPLTSGVLDAAIADDRLEAALALVESHPFDDAEHRHPQAATVVVSLRDGGTIEADTACIGAETLDPPLDAVLARVEDLVSAEAAVAFGEAVRALPGGRVGDILQPLRGETDGDA